MSFVICAKLMTNTTLGEAAPTATSTPAPSSVPLGGSKLRVASRREVEMLSTSPLRTSSVQVPNPQ
ncbi:hypothetical protein [Nostoc sp.]|uniref:hypothetical protein n=1 Tax=Nostoc sp. TaxID=1180 RepID=UPI002FF9867B